MARQTYNYSPVLWGIVITLAACSFVTTAEAFNRSLEWGKRHHHHRCTHHHPDAQYCRARQSPEQLTSYKSNQHAAFINDRITNYKIQTVVIDPGHGGHDKGCRGAHTQEKHIVLAMAKHLGAAIRQRYPQIEIIYTRTTDVFVPLHERARLANQHQADLFISIHCNYISVDYVRGSETYVMGLHKATDNLAVAKRENAAILLEDNYQKNYDYDPDSPEEHILLSMFQHAYLEQSIAFAEKVEYELQQYAGRRSRGVKQAGFLVLRETTMPSVLIESGFLSNVSEEEYLRTPAGQQQIAQAIFRAFVQYKEEVERNSQTAPSTYNRPPAAATRTTKSSVPIRYQSSITTESHSASESFTAKVGDDFITSTIAQTLGNAERPRVEFVVQLAASPTPIATTDRRWADLAGTVEIIREDGYIKYQLRHFRNFAEADHVRAYLQRRGFEDCFVGAYQGGRRISLQAAQKSIE